MIKQATKPPDELDVYDFDKTIYEGDCSIDFYLFCIRKKPLLLAYLPYQLWYLFLFVIRLEKRSKFKSRFFIFLHGINDTSRYVDKFWECNYKKIKEWYRELDHSRDVIISASPEFLLQPAFIKLKAQTLIATRMDAKTGTIEGENCRGEEKVIRLRQVLDKPVIRRAYSDSLSDMPILALAKERYIIKGDKVMTLQAYARMSRIRKYLSPETID